MREALAFPKMQISWLLPTPQKIKRKGETKATSGHIKASCACRILMRPKAHLSTTPFHMRAAVLLPHRRDSVPLCPNHGPARTQKVSSPPAAADKAEVLQHRVRTLQLRLRFYADARLFAQVFPAARELNSCWCRRSSLTLQTGALSLCDRTNSCNNRWFS